MIIIAAIAAALIFGGIVGFICHRKVRQLKKKLDQIPASDDINVKRLISNSELVTDGDDHIANEAVEMVLNQSQQNKNRENDMDIVSSINQTNVGDEIEIHAMNKDDCQDIINDVNATTMGGIVHDPNTDNGEDMANLEQAPIDNSFNVTN